MIGLVTAQARGEMEKARKKRNREAGHPEDEGTTAAHAAADGARIGHDLREDEDGCEPGMAGKAYAGIGVHDGPGMPMMPGQVSPEEFRRGYLETGHGAPSPMHGPPSVPHVNMTGSRGVLTRLDGRNPAGVGNLR